MMLNVCSVNAWGEDHSGTYQLKWGASCLLLIYSSAWCAQAYKIFHPNSLKLKIKRVLNEVFKKFPFYLRLKVFYVCSRLPPRPPAVMVRSYTR